MGRQYANSSPRHIRVASPHSRGQCNAHSDKPSTSSKTTMYTTDHHVHHRQSSDSRFSFNDLVSSAAGNPLNMHMVMRCLCLRATPWLVKELVHSRKDSNRMQSESISRSLTSHEGDFFVSRL
jgi:hypothetical protein